MLAISIRAWMESAIALQHDSCHDCLKEHLVLGVSEFSDLAIFCVYIRNYVCHVDYILRHERPH